MRLTETAYAKINLALHVRARRADGYHALETLFAFAEDGDRLEAAAAADLTLSVTGEHGGAIDNDNLVLRAARDLRTAFAISAGAAMVLDKRLPVASGIGGGSADAAAALRVLCRLWHLDPADPRVAAIARDLGADVPACLASVSAWGSGRGDDLEPRPNGFEGTPLLLVNPRIPLATGPVFAGWDGVDCGPLDPQHPAGWRNDLEAPARALVPEIAEMLARLAAQSGVRLVRMSGSGATCFALFADNPTRDSAAAALPAEWWRMATRIR
ncbi:4-(cytidine 5'-diphospho)-2-C-methyl-D-erythritol kinase [Sphingomonas sp. 1P06PA]|uniref:4-(cytidine 5'-diphospho)-2-C-methyl-D-erythritol kinase n=1 Tax=Sphingomonas sp. 1P06PA TaxID=554121 RepID=UPI0039A43CB6